MSDDRIFTELSLVQDVLRIDYLQPMEVDGEECHEKRSLFVPVEAVADDIWIKCNHLIFVGGESKGLDAQLWKDGRVTGVKVAMKKGAATGIVVAMKHFKYGAVKSAKIPIGGDAEIRIEEKTLESLAKTALAIVDGARKEVFEDEDDYAEAEAA